MQSPSQRRERAAAELAPHVSQLRPADVVDTLSAGLTQLASLLAARLHDDVELEFGVDSMVAPMSLSQAGKQLRRAGVEIDAYAAVVVEEEATRGGYVTDAGAWFLDWLLQLRLGDDAAHVRQQHSEAYRGQSDRVRRLRFASQLQQAVPESVKTPSVLLLLFPQAVRIAAATAFGDAQRAQQVRTEQVELLPTIGDCPDCRGRVLLNGAGCRNCGNPLWTYAWLRAD